MVGVVTLFAYLSQGQSGDSTNFLKMPYNNIEEEFQKHLAKHGRNYGTKEEYYYRLGIFTTIY